MKSMRAKKNLKDKNEATIIGCLKDNLTEDEGSKITDGENDGDEELERKGNICGPMQSGCEAVFQSVVAVAEVQEKRETRVLTD